jgi:hypothetical protein
MKSIIDGQANILLRQKVITINFRAKPNFDAFTHVLGDVLMQFVVMVGISEHFLHKIICK